MSFLRTAGHKLTNPVCAELNGAEESRSPSELGITLALGGGFARGFAHLGVLEVLEQEHIPVSAIAGTSIGSLLGAAYADGIPVRQICELGRQVRIRDFVRFHRSHPTPQGNDRIGQFVSEWFHSTKVEELPLPMAIVTTDLDAGAPHIFTRGSLDIAIRASCAFPGIFKPVQHEGRRLADGCIVAPVPTAVAARMREGLVLGVTVGSKGSITSSRDNIVQVFDRDRKNSNKNRLMPSWTRDAELLLEPRVQQIDWTDFSRVEEAHAAGAEAMRMALPHLRELLARRMVQISARMTNHHAENRLVS